MLGSRSACSILGFSFCISSTCAALQYLAGVKTAHEHIFGASVGPATVTDKLRGLGHSRTWAVLGCSFCASFPLAILVPAASVLVHISQANLTIRSSRPRIVAAATCIRYASTRPLPRYGAA